jgi:ribonucleotide reductase beta subunit family protein with ferritin-like domain
MPSFKYGQSLATEVRRWGRWIQEEAEQQLSVFWLADEIKVEKDIQDMRVNLTPAERHGVITTLKLFSLYE